jgi:hypothetical protein
MVCRPATSEAGARRPAGAINCIWTTYLGNYHNCSTLAQPVNVAMHMQTHLQLQLNSFWLYSCDAGPGYKAIDWTNNGREIQKMQRFRWTLVDILLKKPNCRKENLQAREPMIPNRYRAILVSTCISAKT